MPVWPSDVEIKVTVAGSQVEDGIAAFDLTDSRERRVQFCEDVSPVRPIATPLLDAGVVIRLRENLGRKDDSTIKLRPCRGTQLAGPWFTDRTRVRVEADWSGERRVIAASFEVELPRGAIADAHQGLDGLLSTEQHDYLAACADIRVNAAALTVLPAVDATRWKLRTTHRELDLDIVVERWVVDDALRFLEFSIRVPAAIAEARNKALERLLRDHGLRPDAEQQTKTRLVIEHLIGSHREATGGID